MNSDQMSLVTRFALRWAFIGEHEKAEVGGIGTTAPTTHSTINWLI